MDAKSLHRTLSIAGVPPWAYSLYDLKDNADCLIQEGRSWVTFFLEKGNEFDRKVFLSESEACLYLEKRLLAIDFRTGVPHEIVNKSYERKQDDR